MLIIGKGAFIGLNASFLNIITEWLSDIKLGRCTTAFYLNENFCCWGSDEGERAPQARQDHVLIWGRVSGVEALEFYLASESPVVYPVFCKPFKNSSGKSLYFNRL